MAAGLGNTERLQHIQYPFLSAKNVRSVMQRREITVQRMQWWDPVVETTWEKWVQEVCLCLIRIMGIIVVSQNRDGWGAFVKLLDCLPKLFRIGWVKLVKICSLCRSELTDHPISGPAKSGIALQVGPTAFCSFEHDISSKHWLDDSFTQPWDFLTWNPSFFCENGWIFMKLFAQSKSP